MKLSITGTTSATIAHAFQDDGKHLCYASFGGVHARETDRARLDQLFDDILHTLAGELHLSREAFLKDCRAVMLVITGTDRRFQDGAFTHLLFGLLRRAGLNLKDNAFYVSGVANATYRAILRNKPGLLIHVGRECSLFGLNRDGNAIVKSAWSTIMGDACSAYMLGQKVLRIICKAYDGIASEDERSIASHALSECGLNDAISLYEDFQDARFQRPGEFEIFLRISDLATILMHEAARGNCIAKMLLEETAEHLFDLAAALIQELNLNAQPFTVVCQGSFIDQCETMCPDLFSKLKRQFPQACFLAPGTYFSRVVGASMLCLSQPNDDMAIETIDTLCASVEALDPESNSELFWQYP